MNLENTKKSENTEEYEIPTIVPTCLSHKPIYAINNYHRIDGHYKNNTDVVGLSLGKAQWDKESFIPSVKIFRYKEEKKRWSRQSEETTLTRALDMATLVIKVLDKIYNGREFEDIVTPFGSIGIDEMFVNDNAVKELNDFLLNKENRADIETHIAMLEQAVKVYHNE